MLFTTSDIGSEKVTVACQRFHQINLKANIKGESVKLTNHSLYLIDEFKPDFIIDAIDDIKGKTLLIEYAIKHNISIISSLGMGNRFDPSQVVITNLNDTSHDPLAKSLRYELRKLNINPVNIKVVFSREAPLIKSQPVSSYMGVTSTAGLLLAHHVIATIIKRETNHET
jgi:tRNA A37 threonylcarbamoyladenosine dehydratase